MPALGRDAPDEAIADAWIGLIKLIDAFDDPTKPYAALSRPEFAFPGDYDHLSRIDEWAAGS
jgi:endoglucanase Acf2